MQGECKVIYTTYFANLKKLPKDIFPISIAGKAPDWYNGAQYRKLAPKYSFFKEWKESHNNDYYIKCFKEQVLDKLDIVNVIRDILDISSNNGYFSNRIALVCYEKPEDFCHRHLVTEWLNNYGFDCKEWYPDENY